MTANPDLCVMAHRRDPDRPRPAVDGLYLCHGHLAELERLVAEMPGRYAALGRVLGGGGGGTFTGRVSGSSSEPLPINPAVADLRHQIAHDLAWWCIYVADERGIARPVASHPTVTGPWLATHVEWCASNRAAAEELLPVLQQLAGQARAITEPTGARRITIGPCIATTDDGPCGGTLYATVRADDDPKPSVIYCPECGAERLSHEWFRFGRIYERRRAAK